VTVSPARRDMPNHADLDGSGALFRDRFRGGADSKLAKATEIGVMVLTEDERRVDRSQSFEAMRRAARSTR